MFLCWSFCNKWTSSKKVLCCVFASCPTRTWSQCAKLAGRTEERLRNAVHEPGSKQPPCPCPSRRPCTHFWMSLSQEAPDTGNRIGCEHDVVSCFEWRCTEHHKASCMHRKGMAQSSSTHGRLLRTCKRSGQGIHICNVIATNISVHTRWYLPVGSVSTISTSPSLDDRSIFLYKWTAQNDELLWTITPDL